VTLEIIGAGFGRTGTMSLKVALEELGFGPCYHMIELFEHFEYVEWWEAAVRGEPVDWEELFRGYRATVDWPGAAFYKELMERYPEARVILTVRDPERWYESAQSTIFDIKDMTFSRGFEMARDLAWQRGFRDVEDRQHMIRAFKRWNEEVKESVPAKRLLIYEAKEGWKPLCDFLGVEVPEGKPFPHLNDADSFRKMES
jgi:Sulfotransferase domain